MTDTKDTDNTGRRPLTLKRADTGTVKQSFSHGRSKQVAVEVKKKKVVLAPGAAPKVARPAAAAPVRAGWSRHSRMLTPRCDHTLCVLNGTLYVVGEGPRPRKPLRDAFGDPAPPRANVECWDAEQRAWRAFMQQLETLARAFAQDAHGIDYHVHANQPRQPGRRLDVPAEVRCHLAQAGPGSMAWLARGDDHVMALRQQGIG